MTPKWLALARSELGEKEIAGVRHNPKIVEWFKKSGNEWIKDDETAWCAAYVGAMLDGAGVKGSGAVSARSYMNWGVKLTKPKPGAIAVFKRGTGWQGHVAFFLREVGDKVEVIGGNQKNAVSIAKFRKSDLLGYRWPDTLGKSKVMKGSFAAFGGGSAITADSAYELASQFDQADSHISAGTVFGLVIGVVIVGGALWALYSRWDAGGRPMPSFAPEWLKNLVAT